MKSTQLAYPTAQFFEGGTTSRPPEPEKSSPENLTKLKLVASRKPEGRQLVELQRKVSHYLQPILSHRFLNNLA